MQIKTNSWIKQNLPFLLKLVLTVGCLVFLVIKYQENSIDLEKITWPQHFSLILLIVSVLMILNWSLEARRWQVSVKPYEPISLRKAASVTLQGLALNLVLPFTTGDATARLLSMRDKYQTTSAMFLNRFIMLFLTLLFALFGVWEMTELSFTLTILILSLLAIALFILRNQLFQFTQYFKNLSGRTLSLIGSISVFRYLIFIGQFVLLFQLFLPEISFSIILTGISWIFISKSIIPSLGGGLGIRETSGVLFFQSIVPDILLVIIPIFILWLINTLLPSILGALLLLKLKTKIAS